MLNIILTLVFSVVMLIFMVFPAMKIVEWIEKRVEISDKWHNPLLLLVVALLSLSIGVFLKLA
jgi:tellurite resistance protein TehA-like permease